MRNFMYIGIVLMLFTSCKKDRALLLPTKEISFGTEVTDTLVGTPVIEKIGAQSIYSYDSLLFVEGRDPLSQLTVYACKTFQPIADLCIKGRAKNEFIYPRSWCQQFYKKNNHVMLIMSNNDYEMKTIDITESLEQKRTVINEVFPLIVNRTRGYSMYIPKENKWLNHYLVSYGKDPMDGIFYPPRFTISNSKKENETEIPVYGRMMYCPINNQRSSYPLQIYQGNMRMKPDESKVVFANFFMPYLFVFDINKRNAIAIHVIGKKTFEDDFSDDDPTDVELGISDICLTDDYIIALCPNGRYRKYVSNNLRPIVRFLNWEGECLFSFYVDQIVSSMAYDERNKQIFCFSPTSETIYKYDVKKYFK